MTIVRGKVTGQQIDIAHKCPECEHWWNEHVGPVINWERQCSYRETHLDLECTCMVDLHKYPQALWDRGPGWNEPVLVASGEPYRCSCGHYYSSHYLIGATATHNEYKCQTCPCTYLRPTHDPVNHPSHYTSHPSGVECITITEHYNFCLGNAIKYIWRAGLKDATDPVQDLEKARWYLDREITRLKSVAAHVATDTASS